MTNLKTLFRKEWLMTLKPAVYMYFYWLLALTLLAPNYPYCVAFGYCLMGIPNLFTIFKANKDLEFNAMLPISREEIVKSKFMSVIFIQVVQILIAIPFALLSCFLINPAGNGVGLDANFTLFASVFIEFSVFNIIFLPGFFSTGYKVATPTFWAFVGYLLTLGLIEGLIAGIPTLNLIFDGYTYIGAQLGLLAIGIILYCLTLFFAYRMSVKKFLRVNL